MMAVFATVSGSASEMVQVTSDGFTIQAFLARPTHAADAVPTVLLLHEWWGLTDHIKEVARRCAQAGYAALAPDLYSRLGDKVTQDPNEAARLMNAVSSQAVLRDLNVATNYLKTQSFVDPLRIGVMGFSMGGTFALTQAAHNSDLKAAVVFYGKVPPLETLDYLLCPVLYHYAAQDGWVTKQEADRLSQGLAQFGKPGAVSTYAECQHGFFDDTRPEVYRKDDAAEAWRRTLAFFGAYLR